MNDAEADAVVKRCISAVEISRRDHRGDRARLKQAYWECVQNMVQAVVQAAANSDSVMRVSPFSDTGDFLFGVARSAAITGVRDKNEEHLFLGLAALAIENLGLDYRETLIELTLLDNSAKKLGCDLEKVFNRLARNCSEEVRRTCLTFFSSGWRSLDAIGYREALDRNGEFTYEQVW